MATSARLLHSVGEAWSHALFGLGSPLGESWIWCMFSKRVPNPGVQCGQRQFGSQEKALGKVGSCFGINLYRLRVLLVN